MTVLPLSFEWQSPFGGFRVSLPQEALLILFFAGTALSVLRHQSANRKWRLFLRHPLTIAIVIQLLWMWTSALGSQDIVTSAKAATMRTLYVLSLFVIGHAFLSGPAHLTVLAKAMGVGLWPAMFLSVGKVALAGFSSSATYESAQPFFSNRVELGAVLVLWMPLAVASLLLGAGPRFRPGSRTVLVCTVVFACITLLVLRARSPLAAIAVTGLAAFLTTRVTSRRFITVVAALFAVTGGLLWSIVSFRAESLATRDASSSPLLSRALGRKPFSEESFTERATRWSAAARMGRDRPFIGFGPNTFEQVSWRYQSADEVTRRSTWRGDEGDAHSEFMTAFAEQGVPGLLLLVAAFAVAIWTGAHVARSASWRRARMGRALCGLCVAYGSMNVLNSFLDAEKVVPLFWLACGALVSLDRADATKGVDH